MWATNLKLNLRFFLTMNNWNKKNVPNTWVLSLTANYHGKNSMSKKLLILNQRNRHNMQNAIYLQEKQLRNMYNAFIKPCLEYGWLTWGKGRGGEEETALSLIDKNICKTLRIMFGKFGTQQHHLISISIFYLLLQILSFCNLNSWKSLLKWKTRTTKNAFSKTIITLLITQNKID